MITITLCCQVAPVGGTARSRATAAVTGGGTATAATPERAADHVAGDTASDTRGECPGLVDTAHSPAGSARLDHPLGNGGDREIAYDTYNQKDNIDTAAAVGNVVGVLQGQDDPTSGSWPAPRRTGRRWEAKGTR